MRTLPCFLFCLIAATVGGCEYSTVFVSGMDELISGRKDYGSIAQRSKAREEAGDGPLAKEVEQLSIEHNSGYFINVAGLIRKAESGDAAARRELALSIYLPESMAAFQLQQLEQSAKDKDPVSLRVLGLARMPEDKYGKVESMTKVKEVKLPTDEQLGTSLLVRAAEAGDARSAYALATAVQPDRAAHWFKVGAVDWKTIRDPGPHDVEGFHLQRANLDYASRNAKGLSKQGGDANEREAKYAIERIKDAGKDLERENRRQNARVEREIAAADAARAQREQDLRELSAAARSYSAAVEADNRTTIESLARTGYGGGGGGTYTAPARSSPSLDPETGVNKAVEYQPGSGQPPRVTVTSPAAPGSTIEYRSGRESLTPAAAPEGRFVYAYFPDGRVQTKAWMVGSIKDGEYEEYMLVQGKHLLKAKGRYESGKKDGTWETYATSGFHSYYYRDTETEYSQGRWHGSRRRWDYAAFCGERIFKVADEFYQFGERDGPQTEFAFNCDLKREVPKRQMNYFGGKIQGTVTTYDDKGMVKSVEQYVDGKPSGMQR